jgi:hypothetical protein
LNLPKQTEDVKTRFRCSSLLNNSIDLIPNARPKSGDVSH